MASLSNANPRTSSSHYSGYDATQIRLYDAMIEAENSCLRIHIFAEARHHSVLSVQMIMCFTIQQIIHQSVELQRKLCRSKKGKNSESCSNEPLLPTHKNLKSISHKPIPVPLCLRISSDDQKEDAEYDETPPITQRCVPSSLIPSSSICPKCNRDCKEHMKCITKNAELFSLSGSFDVHIYNYICIGCNYSIEYDGYKDKIFNKNNKSLYTHALFNEWTITNSKSVITLTAYHATKSSIYYGKGKRFVSMPTFSEAYEAFYIKQKWTKKLNCLYCAKLGRLPKLLGTDCTSLLTKAENISHTITPKESYTLHADDVVKMKAIVNKTGMVYINNKPLREKVKRLLIGKEVRIYSHDKHVNLYKDYNWNDQRIAKLYEELAKAGCKPLVDLLKWYFENQNNIKSKRLKRLIGDLLRALSNYVPLFKLSPHPINYITKRFDFFDFGDSEKVKK
eukprot:122772_1